MSVNVDGSGVRVGAMSDSVDALPDLIASGDLPPDVTVLPGQSGNPGTSEGTALLEIIFDMASGADLFFATGQGGQAQMAQNILDLAAAGCTVIVDDLDVHGRIRPTRGLEQFIAQVIVGPQADAATRDVVPLAEEGVLSVEFGSRHRAAAGLSLESDAIVVIVSEETGAISIAEHGVIDRDIPRDDFAERLARALEMSPADATESPSAGVSFLQE